MPVNVTAKFNLPKFGTKQVAKKPAAKPKSTIKKAVGTIKKAAPVASGTRAGGVGYRKFDGEALWLPNTNRPEWLDGSLPGVWGTYTARTTASARSRQCGLQS